MSKNVQIPESAITVMTDTDTLWETPHAPSWDHARQLAVDLRNGIVALVRLGMELEALRDEFFRNGQGYRSDLRTSFARGGSDDKTPPSVSSARNKGWQIKVQDELGLTHQTAQRIIDKAHYVQMLGEAARGERIEYIDQRKKLVELEPNEKMQTLAAKQLPEVLNGTKNPAAAWAGVVGEGSRKAAGNGADRAPVNHHANIKQGLIKLKTSMKNWKYLSSEQRGEIEDLWQEVFPLIPETLMAMAE